MKKIFLIFIAVIMIAVPLFSLTVSADEEAAGGEGTAVTPDASGTLPGDVSWSYFSQSDHSVLCSVDTEAVYLFQLQPQLGNGVFGFY